MTHGWWEASACHTCFCWQLVQLVLCAACGTGQHCVLSGCCVAERLCVCVCSAANPTGNRNEGLWM